MGEHETQRDLDLKDAAEVRAVATRAEKREDTIDELMAPVIDLLGPKHFARELGIGIEKVDRIYHWKQRRNEQRPPAELFVTTLEVSDAAVQGLLEYLGYEPARKRILLSPEEQLKHYRAALLQFGAKGEELDRQIRGKKEP